MQLLTIEEFHALPEGTELISILDEVKIKGRDYIDLDTRAGLIAWYVRKLPEPTLADSEWIDNS
jgi:hypothetical protein